MPAPRLLKPWTTMKQVWPLLKIEGQHKDPGFQNFGVMVSPKGKCVWTIRYSQGTLARKHLEEKKDGKATPRRNPETTLGLVQFEGSVADGSNILDLCQAQAAAREWIAEQKDPIYAARRRSEREAALAKPLTLRTGFEEYLKNRRTKRAAPLVDRTKKGYRQTFENHLSPAADWPLLSSTVLQWQELLVAIADKSPSRGMEAMNIVSGIYTYYETLELPGLTRNPIRKVRGLSLIMPPEKRESHVPPVNLPALVKSIQALRNGGSKDLLMCYTLGGFRRTAVMRFRRSIISFKKQTEGAVIRVPKGEPGWKAWYGKFPLNSQVAGILRARAEALPPGDDWLFPNRNKKGGVFPHMSNISGSCEIVSEEIGIKIQPHDLRRTFGAICDLMFPGDVALAGALLTHRWALPENPETSITLSYQKKPLKELRNASEVIANAMLEIAGRLPMTDETAAALRRKGIDPENMTMLDLPDDDDE